MTLRELQRDLKNLIFIGKGSTSHPSIWARTVSKRLEVYRYTVRSNWMDTLDSDFPLTKKQFSPEDWAALSESFFKKHPPRTWELNTSVFPFVKFIKWQRVKPFIKELADYELTDMKTLLHPAVVAKGLGVTNPTLVARVYRHQIFDWVEEKAPPHKPPRKKPEVLVFYRDRNHTCHIQEADPLLLLIADHFRRPGAKAESLDQTRKEYLPNNNVDLKKAIHQLKISQILCL